MSLIVFLIYAVIFVFFQTGTLYGGDGGDFVSTAMTGGFAHAPGYPLYSLIGYLLTKLPIENPAWRVTLLSSIPAAITLTMLFGFIRTVTKSWFAGLIASATLGFTYVFFLYSVVPEVFILDIMFSMALLYILYLWSLKGKLKLLLLGGFVFAMSLSHHHIILFMVPAFAFIIHRNRSKLASINTQFFTKLSLVFLLGLSPYIWIPYSTSTIPLYYWGDPDTFVKFIKVVTRAYYGTFIAAQDYNQTILTRLSQIPVLTKFYIDDFLLIGIVIALIGGLYLFKKNIGLFYYLLIGFLFSGPIYFMYASYDYTTAYRAAVAERFLLPSYLMIGLFFGMGIAAIQRFVTDKILEVSSKKIIVYLLLASLAYIPVYIGINTYYRAGVLKGDMTAEKFAEDILNTATPGKRAIFLLQNDNTVFNAQYIHVWKSKEFTNTIPLNPAELSNGFSHRAIKKYYPDIKIPEYGTYHPVADFIIKNYDNFEIYADIHEGYSNLNGIKEGKWIPYGLIYRYYAEDELPDPETIVKRNNELWDIYQNPLDGSLQYYENLQLAHVLEFYQFGRIRTGIYALENGFSEDALVHLNQYEELQPTLQMEIALIGKANAFMDTESCDSAESIVNSIQEIDSEEHYLLMIRFHEECSGNKEQLIFWETELARFERENEIGLEEL